MLKIISRAEVRELLPMADCVDAMQDAMRAASAGLVHAPQRLFMPLIDESAHFGLMPGSAGDPKVYGAKIISFHPDNPAKSLPAIQGFVGLFDHETGQPLTIIEGGELTAIRTAATSGMVTRVLARTDARTHGVFGTGVQAQTHIDAIAAVRTVDEVLIWGRNVEKARALAAQQRKKSGLNVRATENPQEAAGCDIVSTVTGASTPVLLGKWIRAGTHVNLVGAHSPDAREADSELICRAGIYTDLLESLFNESGDILIPIEEGLIDRAHIRGEIGNVLSGKLGGRADNDEITLYKSLGVTAQDLFAAHLVYRNAIAAGIGSDVGLR